MYCPAEPLTNQCDYFEMMMEQHEGGRMEIKKCCQQFCKFSLSLACPPQHGIRTYVGSSCVKIFFQLY